jgi:predicted aspartyl protease
MILGHVRDNFPHVMLTLPGYEGPTPVEFIVDTAYEGDLTLPQSMLARVEASYIGDRPIRLADGTLRDRAYYRLVLDWDEEERIVEIAEMENSPLLGVELMAGYLLQVEITDGGEVSLEPL